MSTQRYVTQWEKYRESDGFWQPTIFRDCVCCDECGVNRHIDEDFSIHFKAHKISWKHDYHVCEDCIDKFLEEEARENENECPVCGEQLSCAKEFADHMLAEHLS